MSLAQGRSYLAIPGPSVMPDRVLNAMHRAAPNIYAGELHEVTASLYPDLRRVALTSAHAAIYIGNGHAAWEAANANMFSRGDRALVAATGRFGHGWAESARRMGVTVDLLEFGRSAAADPARIAETLAADRAREIRAVLVTQVDTSSTAKNDIAAIRAAIDDAGHPALLAVDCIASLACDAFRMDDWGVDVTVAASQKGLMTPPGLGLLWFSDKALDVSRHADLKTPYWDWAPRAFAEEYWQQFCGTAPTHHIYGLREALTMLLDEEGLPHVWARHATLARAVWAAFEVWGQGDSGVRLNIADAAARGHSVTSARIGGPEGAATRLREWCEREAGLTLGIGLGMALPAEPEYHAWLRVAHMGHVNAHSVLGTLATMEAGMVALDIPHGPGGAAAAAAVVAAA